MDGTGEFTAYLAARGYVDQLRHELGEVCEEFDRLLIARGPPRDVAWAANTWRDPRRIPIESIGDGARALRAIQRNWVQFPFRSHRRAALLHAKLPHVSARPLAFPDPAPAAPLGSWTMLDRDTLLAAADCESPFPNGEMLFSEDREAPPNRAYLKLWEALTRRSEYPQAGAVCLDLGSSPGGWTWVLAQLEAVVISVDKAPLDPAIGGLPGVEFRQESAFGIDPLRVGPIDWLFCDVACYPKRLLQLVRRWMDAGTCRRFVCTLKFQGETDHGMAREFAAIEGSRLVHLHHNKHELTWML